MKTIWKKVLYSPQHTIADVQEVELPFASEILTVREQGNTICMWFKCDPEEERTSVYRVTIRGTGHQCSVDDGRYAGSAVIHNGSLVFHVFADLV